MIDGREQTSDLKANVREHNTNPGSGTNEVSVESRDCTLVVLGQTCAKLDICIHPSIEILTTCWPG